jgi:hypothetical protein
MKKATAPIPFAGSQPYQTRHVCAFFNSADDANDESQFSRRFGEDDHQARTRESGNSRGLKAALVEAFVGHGHKWARLR